MLHAQCYKVQDYSCLILAIVSHVTFKVEDVCYVTERAECAT